MSTNATAETGYSAKKAAEIVGITYRQLDYWARTDLVKPSGLQAKGSGSRRTYAYTDLLELRTIKSMLDAGIKLESVRTAFEYVRQELKQDVSSANLVISGSRTVLVRSGEELVDVINSGQGVLNVLSLGGVRDEVDAAIVELFPQSDASTPTVTGSVEATGS